MRTYHDDDVVRNIDADSPTPLIRWSAVVAGLVLGLALLALLSSLWLALAFGSELDEVSGNLEWFVGGSGIVALFVGAILTGYLSGVRGVGTGMLHGFTLWGALLILTLTIGIPSVLNVFTFGRITSEATNGLLASGGADTALWAGFWTILGGFVAAGLGGAIGGGMSRGIRTRTRTVVVDEVEHDHDHDHDGRPVLNTMESDDDDEEPEVAPEERPTSRVG
jgi:hypothetical protein